MDAEIDLAALRGRTSEKWAHYPPHVLPLFVAETDFPVAPAIAQRLRRAIDTGDLGYAQPIDLGSAYSAFARDRYGIAIEPHDVRPLPEVMVGVAELLRVITQPGEPVVINPPVYPPFFSTIEEVGRRIVQVPLLESAGRCELDLDGLDRAMAAGSRVYLLCNPHNPVGRVYTEAELAGIAQIAKTYDAVVLSDEIHAPLTLPGARFIPFAQVAAQAGVRALTLTSASKGWNVAGLKCAVVIAGDDWGRKTLDALPKAMTERTGHLGVIASVAAFSEGVPYLDRVVDHLDRQRVVLRELLDEAGLQNVRYTPPEAGFLAWLDCRDLGLGDDPARVFLERGDVALNPGAAFGREGAFHVRFNFGTSKAIVEEGVRRMRSATLPEK